MARFAAKNSLDGDERWVRDAMLRPRFTLLELGEAVEGVGVHVQDIVFAEPIFRADVALSENAIRGMVLATRLLVFESICTARVVCLRSSPAPTRCRGSGRRALHARGLRCLATAPQDPRRTAYLRLRREHERLFQGE